MKHFLFIIIGTAFFLCLTSCQYSSVSSANRPLVKGTESSLVFVRPDKYTLLGTRSISEYCEIMYERLTPQGNGFVLEIGIRNRGGQHFWDKKGPNFSLAATAYFYDVPMSLSQNVEPVLGAMFNGAPTYISGRQAVQMLRGETTHLKFLCPASNIQGYQVVLSDQI